MSVEVLQFNQADPNVQNAIRQKAFKERRKPEDYQIVLDLDKENTITNATIEEVPGEFTSGLVSSLENVPAAVVGVGAGAAAGALAAPSVIGAPVAAFGAGTAASMGTSYGQRKLLEWAAPSLQRRLDIYSKSNPKSAMLGAGVSSLAPQRMLLGGIAKEALKGGAKGALTRTLAKEGLTGKDVAKLTSLSAGVGAGLDTGIQTFQNYQDTPEEGVIGDTLTALSKVNIPSALAQGALEAGFGSGNIRPWLGKPLGKGLSQLTGRPIMVSPPESGASQQPVGGTQTSGNTIQAIPTDKLEAHNIALDEISKMGPNPSPEQIRNFNNKWLEWAFSADPQGIALIKASKAQLDALALVAKERQDAEVEKQKKQQEEQQRADLLGKATVVGEPVKVDDEIKVFADFLKKGGATKIPVGDGVNSVLIDANAKGLEELKQVNPQAYEILKVKLQQGVDALKAKEAAEEAEKMQEKKDKEAEKARLEAEKAAQRVKDEEEAARLAEEKRQVEGNNLEARKLTAAANLLKAQQKLNAVKGGEGTISSLVPIAPGLGVYGGTMVQGPIETTIPKVTPPTIPIETQAQTPVAKTVTPPAPQTTTEAAPTVPNKSNQKKTWELTGDEEKSLGLKIFERFRAGQKALESGELLVGSPEYQWLKSEANKAGHSLEAPIWQRLPEQIESSGYQGDVRKILTQLGFKPSEREALMARYSWKEGVKVVPVFEALPTGKPTLRLINAGETKKLLADAHKQAILKRIQEGKPNHPEVLDYYKKINEVVPTIPTETVPAVVPPSAVEQTPVAPITPTSTTSVKTLPLKPKRTRGAGKKVQAVTEFDLAQGKKDWQDVQEGTKENYTANLYNYIATSGEVAPRNPKFEVDLPTWNQTEVIKNRLAGKKGMDPEKDIAGMDIIAHAYAKNRAANSKEYVENFKEAFETLLTRAKRGQVPEVSIQALDKSGDTLPDSGIGSTRDPDAIETGDTGELVSSESPVPPTEVPEVQRTAREVINDRRDFWIAKGVTPEQSDGVMNKLLNKGDKSLQDPKKLEAALDAEYGKLVKKGKKAPKLYSDPFQLATIYQGLSNIPTLTKDLTKRLAKGLSLLLDRDISRGGLQNLAEVNPRNAPTVIAGYRDYSQRLQAYNNSWNEPFLAVEKKYKFTPEEHRRVTKHIDYLSTQNGVSPVSLSPRETALFNALEASKMRSFLDKRDGPYIDNTREARQDPNWWWDAEMDSGVRKELQTEAGEKKYRKIYENWYLQEKGSLAGVDDAWNAITGKTVTKMEAEGPTYASMRKAQGIGLPPEMRVKDAALRMFIHNIRAAADLGFHWAFERDPARARIMGISDDGRGVKYDITSESSDLLAADPAGAAKYFPPEEGANLPVDNLAHLEDIKNLRAHLNSARGMNLDMADRITGLVNGLIMGPFTVLRDAATTAGASWEILGVKDMPMLIRGAAKAFMGGAADMKRGGGIRSRRTGDFIGQESEVRDLLTKIGDFGRTWQGRDAGEKAIRNTLWETAKLYEKGLTQRAVGGEAGAIAQMEYFVGNDWKKILGTPEGRQRLSDRFAKGFTEHFQGNYGPEYLPWALVRGTDKQFLRLVFNLSRWGIERANRFREFTIDGVKKTGNIKPLLKYTLGAGVAAVAYDYLMEHLMDKKPREMTMEEYIKFAFNSSFSTKDKIDEFIYTALSKGSLMGFAGLYGQLAENIYKLKEGETGMLPNIPAITMAKKVAERLQQYVTAKGDPTNEDFWYGLLELGKVLATDNIQGARGVEGMLKEEDISAGREGRMFKRLEAKPLENLGDIFNLRSANPFTSSGKFIRETDEGAASSLLPDVLRETERRGFDSPPRAKFPMISKYEEDPAKAVRYYDFLKSIGKGDQLDTDLRLWDLNKKKNATSSLMYKQLREP